MRQLSGFVLSLLCLFYGWASVDGAARGSPVGRQFDFCQACLDLWTDIDSAINSTEAVNACMDFTHDVICLQFLGQYDLDDECLEWYYREYDIILQMFQVGLDALAWDVLEPHEVCGFLTLCPEPPTAHGNFRRLNSDMPNLMQVAVSRLVSHEGLHH